MGLFGKKKETRDLRLLDSSLTFPELPEEMPEEYKSEESIFQKMPDIKQFNPEFSSLSNLPTMPELSSIERRIPSVRMPQAIHRKDAITEIAPPKLEFERKGPVFVKIDKFKEALSNFETIKKRLNETSSLLERIKDGRKKEEEELDRWTEDLEAMKDKISAIDKKIFSGLD